MLEKSILLRSIIDMVKDHQISGAELLDF